LLETNLNWTPYTINLLYNSRYYLRNYSCSQKTLATLINSVKIGDISHNSLHQLLLS